MERFILNNTLARIYKLAFLLDMSPTKHLEGCVKTNR